MMKMKLLQSLFVLAVVGVSGCSEKTDPQPVPPAPAPAPQMPEVNDENCKPESIQALPDDDNRKKFAGKCLRRRDLKKGTDQGLKM